MRLALAVLLCLTTRVSAKQVVDLRFDPTSSTFSVFDLDSNEPIKGDAFRERRHPHHETPSPSECVAQDPISTSLGGKSIWITPDHSTIFVRVDPNKWQELHDGVHFAWFEELEFKKNERAVLLDSKRNMYVKLGANLSYFQQSKPEEFSHRRWQRLKRGTFAIGKGY